MPGREVATADELERCLDEVVPGLEGRDEPLVVVVSVAPDETFEP